MQWSTASNIPVSLSQHVAVSLIVFLPPLPQVLLHLGVLTDKAGFHFAENAFSGAPLGEMVQWSDLIATLHLLGHELEFSTELQHLKEWVEGEGARMVFGGGVGEGKVCENGGCVRGEGVRVCVWEGKVCG